MTSPAYAAADAREARETAATVVRVTGTRDITLPTAADKDSAAIAQTGAGTVDVPLSTRGQVSVGSGRSAVEIGLPDTTTNAAVRHASGTVVYADDAASADVAVQPTAAGVRALVTLKNDSAPHIYRFPIRGPKGSRLVPAAQLLGRDNDTGEVLLVGADSNVLGIFEPAWAKDARGRPIATSYQVQGNTLVQVVDVSAATAFPVVADPSFWRILACAGALAGFVGGNVYVPWKLAKIRRYINGLGGFRKSAMLMLRASTWEERMRYGGKALVGLAELGGVTTVRSACFSR